MGRAGRLAVYLQSMFPPLVMLPAGIAMVGAVHGTLQALTGPQGGGPIHYGWRSWVAAASAVLFMLLMRVFDELKDVESDIALGKAGDPRYKDRPIVTGAVRVEDVRLLRWAVTGLLFLLNLPLFVLRGPDSPGWPVAGLAFLLAYGLAWLSFKWFFWPAIQKNLLLAFATHNPLTGFVILYVVAVWAEGAGLQRLEPLASALLVLGLWLPVSAWETSRKIRVPQDETTYQTYSMLLGWKVAPFLPLLFSAAAAICLTLVTRQAGLGWGYPAALWGAWAILAGACLRFRLAPTTARAKLQPFAELFSVVSSLGLLVAALVARGLEW